MTKITFKLVAYSAIGTLLGVAATPFAIRIAGHGDGWSIGDPVLLPLLYPYSMLMFLIPSYIAFVALAVVSLCQFPIYGFLLGDAAATGADRFARTAMWIGVLHGAFALLGLLISRVL